MDEVEEVDDDTVLVPSITKFGDACWGGVVESEDDEECPESSDVRRRGGPWRRSWDGRRT